MTVMIKSIKNFFASEDYQFAKNLLSFGLIFIGTFGVSVVVLGFLGFIPHEFEKETRDDTFAAQINTYAFRGLGLEDSNGESEYARPLTSKGQLPYRLVASSIDLDIPIQRPASDDYGVLDNALLRGAVYYPGSGLAGQGNIFIFGHSTSFKAVNNKAYQIFNRIKELKPGDTIEVYGETKVYTYKVREVNLVNANAALVDFSPGKNMLTLSTCNSFGNKSDRYVAEADLVDSKNL